MLPSPFLTQMAPDVSREVRFALKCLFAHFTLIRSFICVTSEVINKLGFTREGLTTFLALALLILRTSGICVGPKMGHQTRFIVTNTATSCALKIILTTLLLHQHQNGLPRLHLRRLGVGMLIEDFVGALQAIWTGACRGLRTGQLNFQLCKIAQ